jgi:NAD(P)-dependent dehydrogenase (short-subunit alcohol dehydrogenase family)
VVRVQELSGRVAVVTGGAGGIGRGIVHALLDEGVKVVIADIEQSALDRVTAELADRGEVSGVATDVSDFESVDALAAGVFERYGACHLLFNNAGVTSGGGGNVWENESNDWRWCFGVNVFGAAHGVSAFVPRMIESGEPGNVVNTSSGDGGFAPVPRAAVYASSKAAITCMTEALAHQLIDGGTNVRASVFYPSGGLLDTGLFVAARNRPPALARVHQPDSKRSMTFDELKAMVEKSGRKAKVMDLDVLGRFVIEAVKDDRFIIAYNLESTAELLHRRADAIARAELPPHHQMGV